MIETQSADWIINYYKEFNDKYGEQIHEFRDMYLQTVRKEVTERGGDGGTSKMYVLYSTLRDYLIQNLNGYNDKSKESWEYLREKFKISVKSHHPRIKLTKHQSLHLNKLINLYGERETIIMVAEASKVMSRGLRRSKKPLLPASRAIYEEAMSFLHKWAKLEILKQDKYMGELVKNRASSNS